MKSHLRKLFLEYGTNLKNIELAFGHYKQILRIRVLQCNKILVSYNINKFKRN